MMSSGGCGLERARQILLEPVAVAVDDALLQALLDRLGPARFLRRLRRLAVLEEGDEGLQRIIARRGGGRRSDPRRPARSLRRILCSGMILETWTMAAGHPALHRMVEEHRIQHVRAPAD